MNQFEKMMYALNLYEQENKKMGAIKEENALKKSQLKEQFETLKNTHEQNVKKELDEIYKDYEKLENKKINLKQELNEAPIENVSNEFLSYIDNSIKTIEKQMQKNNETSVEVKKSSNITLKKYEEELNKKISALNNQLKQQEELLKNAVNLLKENEFNITKNELEAFLIDYIKQTTGKNFIKMDDETKYQYDYYEDYETYYDNYYFRGLKCANTNFTTFEELSKGIKNKKVILLNIRGEYSFTDEHNLFSLEDSNKLKHILEYDKSKLNAIPYLTFLQNDNLENSYFTIYPDLKEKLLSYMESKFIKEEKAKLENAKKYINNLKNEIDTNEQQMNKEIDNMIKKIKDKYLKKLKDDKIEYFEIMSKYNTKKQEFETFTNKDKSKVVKTVEEELEK